jgi:hypothetical protein
MNDAIRDPRWHHPWRQHNAAAPQDPADLGTAFGLDLSLQREWEDAGCPLTGPDGAPALEPRQRPD